MPVETIPTVAERPAEVIDLRREQAEFWSRDGQLQRALAMQGRRRWEGTPETLTRRAEGEAARHWFYETVTRAELYWVSPDMVNLLAAVASTVPDVTPFPPVPEALVVFARPISGLDSKSGITIHTAAYMWGPVIMASPMGPVPCVAIETMGWKEFMHPVPGPDGSDPETMQLEAEWRRLIPTRLVNTGSSEWPIRSMTSDFSTIPADTEIAQESILEDRRLLTAFWALLSQRITVESLDHGDRPARRRAERAGIQKLDPVRVIRLRERATSEADGQSGSVDWTHRWIVGAHWRRQWHPSTETHVPTLIQPYVKGPAHKPLVVRETVRALVR